MTVLILLVFVWLITRKLKYLFLIVTSLAVNIAVALIFYYLFGLEMQLYSLAGITVSLNLVIDSTIVMTDHILHRRNLKAFLSVLAATLTTMGALVIIFFLDERIRLNLQDFAAVVIINLAVSLMVALFFVPSMIEKIGLVRRITGKKRRLVLPGLTQTFKTRFGTDFQTFPRLFLLLLLCSHPFFCAVGAGLYACCYCWVSVCPFFCCPTNWKEGENGKLLTIRYSVRIPIRSR